MLVAQERLRPFLVHAEPDVRTFVMDYFCDIGSDDPDVVTRVLDAYEQYGTDDDLRSLTSLDRLRLTEPALDRILGLLERVADGRAVQVLSAIVSRAPGAVLHACCDAVEANPKILPRELPRIRRRRAFVDWSGERLWQALLDCTRQPKGRPAAGEIDQDYAADLVEALSRHAVPDPETLGRLLHETTTGWLETYLVDLAGYRRSRGAVPVLVAKLHGDDDFLPGRVAAALGRIGDPEAVRLIRAEYAKASFHYRLYACEALGYLKHFESEAAIIDLLDQEQDEGLRMWLCLALCDLFSDRAVEIATREVGIARSVGVFRELCAPTLVVSTVAGIAPPPDVARWETERHRQRRAIAASLPAQVDDPKPEPPEAAAPAAIADEEPAEAVIAPIHNTGPRIGRNDRCPCGSGKKYKKCCGRAQ